MTPRASTSASAPAADMSTLSANGEPKGKRKRVRMRKRGGRRGRGAADLDLSSSSDDDSSDEDEQNEPVASTSASKVVDIKSAKLTNGKQAAGKKSGSEEEDDEESDSDSSSGSSTSSFLTSSSDEDEESAPAPILNANQATSLANGHTNVNYSAARQASTFVEDLPQRQRRSSPVREPSPPYLTFGIDADAQAAAQRKAAGKPILWGLLPTDRQAAQAIASGSMTAAQQAEEDERQQAAYLRFREHYVNCMIQRFGSSLDDIRKREGQDLKPSRLQVLISNIGNGADNFTSKHGQGIWKSDGNGERELVLEAMDAADARNRSTPGNSDNADMSDT